MPTLKCARKECGKEVVVHIRADVTANEKWASQKATTYCSVRCVKITAGEKTNEDETDALTP